MRSNFFPVFALGVFAFGHAVAQDETASATTATPLEKRGPEYPRPELARGREGWVVVSYVISKSGEVIEPMIEDSSGIENFENEAMSMVRSWKFEPAVVDGNPVEQAMNNVRVVFQMQESEMGARSAFVRAYNRVATSIAEGELDTAFEELVELDERMRNNLYEDSWYWWLNFLYLDASGSPDRDRMKDSLQKAIGYEEFYLPADVFVAAAQRLYVMHIEDGEISDALATLERLQNAEPAREAETYEAVTAQLTQHATALRSLIEGPNVLASPAEIGRYGYWVHDLMRDSFSVVEPNGRVDLVDIRCATGTARFAEIDDSKVWTIPESWDDCGVYIKGEPGATFTLYEYPATP